MQDQKEKPTVDQTEPKWKWSPCRLHMCQQSLCITTTRTETTPQKFDGRFAQSYLSQLWS
jgi:hypothetical protein